MEKRKMLAELMLMEDDSSSDDESDPTMSDDESSNGIAGIRAFLMSSRAVKEFAEDFLRFLNKAVTPYHAVHECKELLISAGFKELKEGDNWGEAKPLSKCFVTRNDSCLLAFAVGGKFKPGNGASIIAAHTDSPCPKVKPVSKVANGNVLQVGVSPYGGGIWRTWFDRDLTVAGIVMFQKEGKLGKKLVNVKKPILSIPSLCIHLDPDREKFVLNKEDHLKPILGTKIMQALQKEEEPAGDHHPEFLKLIAESAGIEVGDIVSFDLCLVDTQPAALTGLYEEFVSGARLDNLVGTYTSVKGFLESLEEADAFAADPNLRIVACYDNEEVGSESAQGAKSGVTEWLLRRLQVGGSATAFEEAMAKSYIISADQAHAIHPNYKAKHEENHAIGFHGGVVVKINANQRYATSARSHAILEVIAKKADVPLQKFVIRNDSLCGSTVGPFMASNLGIETIDVGTTQLAMHSIREIADTTGLLHAKQLYTAFYKQLPSVVADLN